MKSIKLKLGNILWTILFHLDVNECVLKTDNCHQDASCENIKGSFSCQCNHGYEGNGTHCQGL